MSGKPVMVFINHWARDLGGAEHSLLDILQFARHDAAVHLVTSEGGKLVERAQALGIQCTIIPCNAALQGIRRDHLLQSLLTKWKIILSFLLYTVRVSRRIREISPSLIHANVPKSHMTLFILRLLGYKGHCCFHIREIFDSKSLPSLLYTVLFPGSNSSVISISRAARESLPPSIRQASTVIYNGIEIPPVCKAHTGNGVKFLYLGRIVPWKGCEQLIEAFSLLVKDSSVPVECNLVGGTIYWDTSYREQLAGMIRERGIADRCRILDHTNDPVSVMMDHDVFCNCSDREPFGRSIAEAQACGLPVVAFSTGGIPEILEHEHTGLLTEYGDVKQFARMMKRFIDEPDLAGRMGKAGRERMKEFFERDKQMQNIVKMLVSRALPEEVPGN